MKYDHIVVPPEGEAITMRMNHSLAVPDNPIIPCIEGDGIGIDVTPVMIKVVDAAVAKAYATQRRICWMQIYAGQAAVERYGKDTYLPDETLHAMQRFVISIKGPLATPVGQGIRSLNVAIRQNLDLYACVRPIRYFPGVSTPMKSSNLVSSRFRARAPSDWFAGRSSTALTGTGRR